MRLHLLKLILASGLSISLAGCATSPEIREIMDDVKEKVAEGVEKITENLPESLRRDVQESVEKGADSVASKMSNLADSVFVEAGDDKTTVRTYSRNSQYAFEGAVAGIITGVGLSCVTNVTRDKECFDKAGLSAAIGGGLGAVGGWTVAARQRKLEGDSISLDQQLNSARLELDQATRTREAAERLTSQHIIDINALKQKANSSESARRDLEKEIIDAKETLELLGNSNERMGQEIAAIKKTIDQEKNSNARTEYAGVRKKLIEEKASLQKAINRLNKTV